ncbi:hypothetical protein [Tenacibaculum agarivorans]|uniref:hypothetical protein n=1 Tax=Tenacibaculum agarivorans TaxID=1908389 RepID=UPI00094BAD2C|nr:hypothetical protein [Tenacibaculum agarivorans]
MLKIRSLALGLIFFSFFSCSQKLNLIQIEKKINERYRASFEGDIECLMNNVPIKVLKDLGDKKIREDYKSIYEEKDEFPVFVSEISELKVNDEGKCESYRFYDVNYKVTKTTKTPYLDSTALKLNYKNYGKENVSFNSDTKILKVNQIQSFMLVLDKDYKWKVVPNDLKILASSFGDNFSKCIEKK